MSTIHRPSLMLMLMSSPSTSPNTRSSNHPPQIFTVHCRYHCSTREHGVTAFLPARAPYAPVFFDTSGTNPRPPQRQRGYLLRAIIRASPLLTFFCCHHPPGITDGTILIYNGGYYITTIPINFLIQPTNKILYYNPDTHQAWFSRTLIRWSIFSFCPATLECLL